MNKAHYLHKSHTILTEIKVFSDIKFCSVIQHFSTHQLIRRITKLKRKEKKN